MTLAGSTGPEDAGDAEIGFIAFNEIAATEISWSVPDAYSIHATPGPTVFTDPQTGAELLRLESDAFYVRGVKVPQDDTEAGRSMRRSWYGAE